MTAATPTTGNTTYYAIYSKNNVKIYYPNSTSAATNATWYRNEYFTSTSAMGATLNTSRSTSNGSITSSVSGYTFHGLATALSSTTVDNIANSAKSTTTTFYVVSKATATVEATFYYNSNKTSGSLKTSTFIYLRF